VAVDIFFSDRFFFVTAKTAKTGRVTTKTVKFSSPPKVHCFCHFFFLSLFCHHQNRGVTTKTDFFFIHHQKYLFLFA